MRKKLYEKSINNFELKLLESKLILIITSK